MRKIQLILCIQFLFFFSLSAQEYSKWGISTNIPSYILLSPNIKGEMYLSPHSSVYVDGSYGWWDLDWDKKKGFRQWHVSAGYNYYLKDDATFIGHRFGISMKTGQFDKKKHEDARKGHFSTFGVTYGYTWNLGKNFYLDAGCGVGYLYRFYHHYLYAEKDDQYYCTSHRSKHRFGITDFNVSIIYRFPKKK